MHCDVDSTCLLMKTLTDEQYNVLTDYANDRGMSLNGYTITGGSVLLYNSIHDGVHGKTMEDLKAAIDRVTR